MKLSDYVIDFLVQHKVHRVFGMSGGAAVHMFDSVSKRPEIDIICSSHEQGAGFSADGYARLTGRLGVAIVTSGPGATNLLTATCSSYYDSVPTLMLTGQVATHRLRGDREVRQMGFQETDVVDIFKPVTKYAVRVERPEQIRHVLEEAYHVAFCGRPGPVLVDIPDDLQRADIDPARLPGYQAPIVRSPDFECDIDEIKALLGEAERPVLVLGGGLSTPRVGGELDLLIERLNMPVLVSWAGTDLIAYDHPLRVGPFGVYGPRLGNFAIQNADLLIVLGTRMSQNLTGSLLQCFARRARIVMVDISRGELDKFDGRGIEVGVRINARATDFIPAFLDALENQPRRDYAGWRRQIDHWRDALPSDRPNVISPGAGFVDAYHFVERLSDHIGADEQVFVDTGGNLTWTCNGIRMKRGQRLMSAWNHTPMGYALPAAIGGATAGAGSSVTCIIGDGGLMICLGELATLLRNRLPVKVILINNHSHGIQKQTLDTWLGGNYVGVDEASGLAFVDFPRVAAAMGFKVVTIDNSADIDAKLKDVYSIEGPVFCNVEINPDQKLYPVVKFGSSLERQLPAMDDQAIMREMIVAE